jgi:hypothetical protein
VSLARCAAASRFDGRVAWGAGNQVSTRLAQLAITGQAAVQEARAASLTDASGGFAVPYTLDPTLDPHERWDRQPVAPSGPGGESAGSATR